MKTTIRLIGVVAIAMVLSIAFSGVALACCPVPETMCTSKIETTTQVTCLGTMTEDESLIFEQSSVSLIPLPPLIFGERYGSTSYAMDMIARNGVIDFLKDFEFDTENSAGIPDYNLDVATTFDYAAYAGGRLTSSEVVSIDAISAQQNVPGTIICPFAAGGAAIVPESCEYIEAGSTLDVTEVSARSNTQTITNARSNDITPIMLHYDIHAGSTSLGPSAGAVGSASAFMTVHEMEGRGAVPGDLGAEVTFDEETTVSGIFDLFKNMDYDAGVSRP